MSRLKALLRVATPSTCNTQQTGAFDVQQSVTTSEEVYFPQQNAQQNTQNSAQFVAQKKELLHAAHGVAQHVHTAQQADWQEFEALLAIVAPAHRTPTHELDEIRAAARDDLAAALVGQRSRFVAAGQGCLAWRESGLSDTPQCVRAATSVYEVESDLLGLWIDERCETKPGGRTASGELYQSYAAWCVSGGMRPISAISFGRALGERGFVLSRTGAQRFWNGISLSIFP